jgi:beta-galactosidase/beta-glucuronidase
MMRKFILTFAVAVCAAVAQEVPRPEYPQPQFEREAWQTLNGTWEFEFDDSNAGLDANWGAGTKKLSRTILVPFCFESTRSGIGDTSFHPWVWYRRSFTIPADWKGRRVLLHFGAVDYRAKVWVNGQYLGDHTGGSTPFRFDVTPALKEGTNVVVLRAEDPPANRFIPRGKQYWEPKSRGIFYTRTTGIWQPVWLEATGETYLDRVRITPSISGMVKFEGYASRPQPGVEFMATIRSGNDVVATGGGPLDDRRVTAAMVVRDPKLWSPGAPNLYDVVFELRKGGQVLDRVNSYFGFREVATGNGRVVLNGRSMYLKLVLDQGYWPESLLTPPSDEAIKYDLQMTKDMGFNGARKHQKIEDPRYLYWADRMGMLVSGEIANAYLFDAEYVQDFTREWMEAVERDYNHPSIIMWVPINESWGTENLIGSPQQQNHLKAMYTLTKSLDPTRLVIDNDGWEHTDMTDVMAIHDYSPRGELLYEKYKDMHKEHSSVPPVSRVSILPGYKYNGTPFYLSEFGGISYIMPGQKVPEAAWGYSGVEPDQNAAFARLESLYQGIAKTPAWIGICYTQLTDVEQEINGLMTYDRKPKFDVKKVKALNDLLR